MVTIARSCRVGFPSETKRRFSTIAFTRLSRINAVQGERARLGRRGWRLASHILTREKCPTVLVTLNA